MWHLQVFSWTCWPSPDKCLNHAVPLRWGEIKISVEAFWKCVNRAKRLSITFRSDGKREFVPRDQVSPLLVVYYCSLFLGIISNQGPNINLVVSRNFLSIRIVLSCFYLLIFYFEKFLTSISRAWNWFSRGNLPVEYWHEQLGWRDNTLCFALSKISDRALSLKIFEIWQIWLPRRWRRKNLKKGLLPQLELYQSKWS